MPASEDHPALPPFNLNDLPGWWRSVHDTPEAQDLRGLFRKPHLFHASYDREYWEDAARANVERELATEET